jgi:large subunit ribosomal protein L25
VKQGGILEQVTYEVNLECLPTDIPDHLEVDVSGLAIGDSIRVRELAMPPGVTMLTPGDEVLVVISPPVTEEEVAAAEAEEEGAVVEELAEPELVGEAEEEGEAEPRRGSE